MKKKMLLFAFILPIFVFGQTYIKDKQEVFGMWTADGSPYIVEGEAIVPTGKTLVIKEGVVIQFKVGTDRDYRNDDEINQKFDVGFLRVNGKIIAKGTSKKLITFTSYGTGTWGNVCLINTNDNVFEYCQFSNSYYIRSVTETDNATGALSFLGSNGVVKNCIFSRNGWTAINCKKEAKPQLMNITIVDNKYGIECNTKSAPVIQNVILWNNEDPFYINGGATPSIQNTSIQEETFPDGAVDKGGNIIGTNPMFIDSENKNYQLQSISPLIGKKMGFSFFTVVSKK
jgi:hypothetical protein